MPSPDDESLPTAPTSAEPWTLTQLHELRKDELVVLVMQENQHIEKQAAAIHALQLKVESLSASTASSPPANHGTQIRPFNHEAHDSPVADRTALITAPDATAQQPTATVQQPLFGLVDFEFDLIDFEFSMVEFWLEQAKALVAHTHPARALGILYKSFPEGDRRDYFKLLIRQNTLATGPDWPTIWESLSEFKAARLPVLRSDLRRAIATMKLPSSKDEAGYENSVMALQIAALHGISYETPKHPSRAASTSI